MKEVSGIVHNAMEPVVEQLYKQHHNLLNMRCNCKKCEADVFAMVLNEIPPRYITNDNFAPYIKVAFEGDPQQLTKLLSLITRAAKFVSDHPRCQDEEKLNDTDVKE